MNDFLVLNVCIVFFFFGFSKTIIYTIQKHFERFLSQAMFGSKNCFNSSHRLPFPVRKEGGRKGGREGGREEGRAEGGKFFVSGQCVYISRTAHKTKRKTTPTHF